METVYLMSQWIQILFCTLSTSSWKRLVSQNISCFSFTVYLIVYNTFAGIHSLLLEFNKSLHSKYMSFQSLKDLVSLIFRVFLHNLLFPHHTQKSMVYPVTRLFLLFQTLKEIKVAFSLPTLLQVWDNQLI